MSSANEAHRVAAQHPWPQRLGGFARMLPREGINELAEALDAAGLRQVQLNLSAVGLPTIPQGSDLSTLDLPRIRATLAAHGLTLWGLSATYNMAHPDATIRRSATNAAADYLRAMPDDSAVATTLCTGSRDPHDQWRAHPENRTEEAWRDFRAELDVLLEASSPTGPVLGIEPEPGNVVADTDAAERLVRELGSDADRIGFILDPANLLTEHPHHEHAAVLSEAFDRLGPRTVCVHAKDTVPWSETISGRGVVDYPAVISLMASLPIDAVHGPAPLIIQDASEAEVPAVLDVLRSAINAAESAQ